MTRKLLILGISLVVLTGLVYAIGIAIARHNKFPVNVSASPSDSLITVDNKRIASGTVYLPPGSHTFIVTHTLFDSVEQKITVQKTANNRVILLASSTSEAAKKWLADHPEEDRLRQKLSSESSNLAGSTLLQQNPIVNVLPFIDNTYRIDYGPSVTHPDDPTAIAIYIKSTDDVAKQDALAWLKFKGYAPSKLEIYYSSFD